jgi:diadenosine tetraphosphatase ApaH/serine/threonine PP2A family protein phosphatase
MKAIISDIHSNLEALHAVLEDMEQFHVEDVYCLGDLVGYGPNPRECVGLALEWDVCLMGNHDYAAIHTPQNFGVAAERAILWTTRQLREPVPTQADADRRWSFLARLPHSHRDDDDLFVHASPRNPLNEYVFPEDIYHRKKLDAIFARIDRCCFVGHTHLPGIFTANAQSHAPEELDYSYRLGDGKILCNVGSVGQPRDGDERACYVLFDGKTIRFRRVDYDVDATVAKIRPNDDLDDFLGDRLREGV